MNQTMPERIRAARPMRGFSLIEVAIGLVILGLAAVGLLASLSKQAEQRKFATTRSQLDQVRDAVLAFSASEGRLPCPAIATSAGQESIAAIAAGTVRCSTESGLLPAVTLGLPGLDGNGLLNDGWQDGAGVANQTYLRSLRYGISRLAAPVLDAPSSPGLGAPGVLTRRIDVQTSITNGQGLFVCRSSVGLAGAGNRCGAAANTLSTNAVAVIWSRGINGNSPGLYSADELQNANQPIARVYVARDYAPPDALAGGFDDLLTWIPYAQFAQKLMAAGHVQ